APGPGWLAAQQTAGAGPYAPFTPSPIGGEGRILQAGQEGPTGPFGSWVPQGTVTPTTPGPASPVIGVQQGPSLAPPVQTIPSVADVPVLQPGQQAPGERSTLEQQAAALLPGGYEQPSTPPSVEQQASLLGLGGYQQVPSVGGDVAALTPQDAARL